MGDFSALRGTAIVIGGTGGIGTEIVRMLAARGTRVGFTYRGNAQQGSRTRHSSVDVSA